MKRALAFLTLSTISAVYMAGAAYAQGDFYIRSDHSNGGFNGSHEILTLPKKGYHEARYCDRTFWVSSGTVVWTEEEVAAGRSLIVEENIGAERRVVCSDYSAFATLEDLGLKKREIEQIRRRNEPLDMKSTRLRTIRDAFSQFK
ncbi:hypothetical protein [uncultured Roseibium sp.]|uniref:hypothetical protein n=1 Tax=uncultured Roseibium sp. TaxID=1936171 RepID=UPI0026331F36|nr:hypothetical protein [uncultured Roseibium sp.]